MQNMSYTLLIWYIMICTFLLLVITLFQKKYQELLILQNKINQIFFFREWI